MVRGTTPDYILTVQGYDLTDKTVYVTIRQGQKQITKTDDLSIAYSEGATTIAFSLTQEETLALAEGSASVQVRFIDSEGMALATNIKQLQVRKVLLERTIAYE